MKDTNYVELVECLEIEAIEGSDGIIQVSESDHVEKVKAVYPRAEKELMDFLNRCKEKKFQSYVM